MFPEYILPEGITDYVNLPLEYFDVLDDYIPTEVCHYTSRETALEKILWNKEILIGQLGSTNDPRESQPWMIPYVGFTSMETEEEMFKEMMEINADVNRIKREEWRVLCTTCHNNPSWDFINPKEKYIDHHQFGVGYSRMWAQYGGKHAGICLLFDGHKLHNNIQESLKDKHCEIRHGFVKYDYSQSVAVSPTTNLEFQGHGTTEMIRKSLLKHYDSNFLSKSDEWKGEHEFRWLVHSADYPKDKQMLISIEGALKAIIVGVDFPPAYIPVLEKICRQLDIPAGKITWSKGRPYVDRFSINRPSRYKKE